jgi:hypothetical protein
MEYFEMAHRWRETIRLSLKFITAMHGEQKYEKLHYISRIGEVFSRTLPRQCPICGYQGFFLSYGVQNRPEAKCPRCNSLERHRLIYLTLMPNGQCIFKGKDVLHFAPEWCLEDLARRTANLYVSADLLRHDVDLRLNIANIGLADNTFDIVICNQVLQDVRDDVSALKEIFRILRPHGTAIINVTMIDGWENTFESEQIISSLDRHKYFGYDEIVRLYGRDFRSRTEKAGFVTELFQPAFQDHVRYGIVFGEKVFLCRKPG